MPTAEPTTPAAPDPVRPARRAGEPGAQPPLAESWADAQEFWNRMARSWGETASAWMRNAPRDDRRQASVVRELFEAHLAVGQAWLRLPLVLVGGASVTDLPQAVLRLTEAQGRALQLWFDTIVQPGRPAGPGR